MNVYRLYGTLFGSPRFANFNRLLHRLALRGMGVYNYENSRISGEEWVVVNIVRNLGSNLVIFDVGANVGDYSRLMVNSGVSVKQIFAFEPHPKTYQRLVDNTNDLQNIVCVNIAVSDSAGEVSFYDRDVDDGTSHASIHADVFSDIYRVQHREYRVNADTLDVFCANESIEYIDFLKIDVEGHELNVLRGAEKMLEEKRVRAIQFEFTQLNAAVGVFFKEFWEKLSPHYRVYRLLPHGLLPIDEYDPPLCEIFGYQNSLTILKD